MFFWTNHKNITRFHKKYLAAYKISVDTDTKKKYRK